MGGGTIVLKKIKKNKTIPKSTVFVFNFWGCHSHAYYPWNWLLLHFIYYLYRTSEKKLLQ